MSKFQAHVADQVRGDVDRELRPLYLRFEEWRAKVLHDPVREGGSAAARAAAPYEHALQQAEARASQDVRSAVLLRRQARALRLRASALMRHAGTAAGLGSSSA